MTDSLTPEPQSAFILAAAAERLRQEQETFNLRKSQDEQYFRIRKAMGWVVVITLPTILVTCLLIIIFHSSFSGETVAAATTALLVDGVGAILSFYRLVIAADSQREVRPITASPELEA